MARNPETTYSITLVDRSGELARISFAPSDDFTANALDASPPATSVAGQFFTALNALISGATLRRSLTTTRRIQNLAYANEGQREERWLVMYEDNVTKALYSFELPCRRTNLLPPANQDEVDLSVAPFAAFKTAAEAAILSPDGNSITIRAIRLIGRNV